MFSRFAIVILVLMLPAIAIFGQERQEIPSSSESSERPAARAADSAIEEFRTITRERGLRKDSPKPFQAGGGRLPRYHGRLTYNLRNDVFDAIPHQIKQRGGDASILRRHQFGFNVSGPIFVPKLYNGGTRTFFTLSYEGVRESVARSMLNTIPILPERSGDFSQTVDQSGLPLPIFDPASTSPNSAFDPSQPVSEQNLQYNRTRFVDNRIPVTRLDPVAMAATQFFPDPNTDVGPFFRNNYFVVSPERNVVDGFTGRLDHILNDSHRVNFSFTSSDAFVGSAKWFDNAANTGVPDRVEEDRSYGFNHIYTISPETINTFSFNVSSSGLRNVSDEETDYPDLLGLHGRLGTVFPSFHIIDGYLDLGRPNIIRRNQSHTFQVSDTFSTRFHNHNLRFIGRLVKYQINTYQPAYPSGNYQFQSNFTALPGIVNTGHAFATFLLGQADYAELSVIDNPSYWRRGLSSGRVIDQLELRKGLNLTIDLNLEYNSPRVEKYNRQSTVDLSVVNPETGNKGALVFAGRDGYGRSFQSPTTMLEPRFSIAWNPTNEAGTVLRSHYARSYSPRPLQWGHWGTQGFNLYPTFISANRLLDPALVLRNGVPVDTAVAPDLSPSAADDTNANLMNLSSNISTYESFGMSLEGEIPGHLLLVVSANRDSGRNLFTSESVTNPNAVPLDYLSYRDQLNDEEFVRHLRPFSQYQLFSLGGLWPVARYNRDQAAIRIERRASAGLTLRGSYSFSKQMDNYSGPTAIQDMYNLRKEWAVTAWNNPQVLSLNYAYELPFGPNKSIFPYSDWRRYLVAGWSVNGTSTVVSGSPLSPRPTFNNTGGVVRGLYVNLVPGVSPRLEHPSAELWFNPEAFSHPDDFTIGNASRNLANLYGPMRQNHDLSVSKRINLSTNQSLEFTAVGLNFLNHANLDDPDTQIGTAAAPNVNAGKIIQSTGGRIIQVGLRLNF
ncbi:MAG: hypothetical protein LC114_25975 [Bryobacterales bacterium]|nr:hypothetical protein [Bryobacterales bacterium]